MHMPYMGGVQLARETKKLMSRGEFKIDIKSVMVAAEEYEDNEGLFEAIFFKPLPINQISEVYKKYFN